MTCSYRKHKVQKLICKTKIHVKWLELEIGYFSNILIILYCSKETTLFFQRFVSER